MKRIILCLSLFAFFGSQAQQINPVPDYVFRNQMSVGRNAVTDTAAYISIGPRYGANKGLMPPIVSDTAAITGVKRNGLLIFSVQRNNFQYWDSINSRWTSITANVDTTIISTRAWRQKGIDSVASVRIGGSGTINRHAKFTASGTLGNGGIADTASAVTMALTATNRVLINTSTDAGYQLDVNGTARTGTLTVNTNGQGRTIRTDQASGTIGNNIFIGGAGGTLTGTSGNQSSQNVTLGVSAGNSITTSFNAVAIGYQASNALTTASNTIAIGTNALLNNNGNSNVAIGSNASSANVSGTQNTAVGASALQNATTSNNSAFGASALGGLTSGANNDAFGVGALQSATTGSNNVAVGQTALFGVITTSNNTAIGANAGRFINVGTQNNNPVGSVFIGHDTRASDTAQSNQIVIGHQARGNGSNTVTIGNSSITQNYFRGEMLVGYTSDQGAFSLQANGNALINGNIRTAAPAGGTANDWRLGTVATVSPTSPNRTIEVEIGGTTYYIHAKTTND